MVGGETGRRGSLSRPVASPPVSHIAVSELEYAPPGADALFFDGTLFTDDEMIAHGLGTKTGRRMGHISIGGPEGTLASLADVAVGRRILIHINNSNPVLVEGSPERRQAEAAGWEIAYDGMEVVL